MVRRIESLNPSKFAAFRSCMHTTSTFDTIFSVQRCFCPVLSEKLESSNKVTARSKYSVQKQKQRFGDGSDFITQKLIESRLIIVTIKDYC